MKSFIKALWQGLSRSVWYSGGSVIALYLATVVFWLWAIFVLVMGWEDVKEAFLMALGATAASAASLVLGYLSKEPTMEQWEPGPACSTCGQRMYDFGAAAYMCGECGSTTGRL